MRLPGSRGWHFHRRDRPFKISGGAAHTPAKCTRSPRNPLRKTRLPPQCPRMGPLFLRGIFPPEARRLNSAFSPSYLASVRLFCQPNIKARPLASQTRHSHSVGLHSHLVIITSNMIRAEYIERHRYHDVGLPAVDRIRHQHQAVPPNSPRTNQRRKIAARKLVEIANSIAGSKVTASILQAGIE